MITGPDLVQKLAEQVRARPRLLPVPLEIGKLPESFPFPTGRLGRP